MAYKIVLTADRTLMSSYNASQFIGFAACFPRVLPKPVYTKLFCPTRPRSDGIAEVCPAGLRKIEAALIRDGFSRDEVVVAHPDKLSRVVSEDTKVIGINTSDPMGIGPASSTFRQLIRREPYTQFYFRKLVTDPAVRGSGAKVIVGGPGAWQLYDASLRKTLGIDCLVDGEGENVAPELFRAAASGGDIPELVTGGPVPIDRIPEILGPTVNGTVEISRGCGRGCEFCNPNMRTVRHIPLERILSEVRTNLSYGNKITLHAEDVLRYRAKGMRPDWERVSQLFEEVRKLTDNVGLSHIALSSALAEPKVIEEISRITDAADGRRRVYAQTGIETGSKELVQKHLKGKAKPFNPDAWPEVVKESFKLLADNNWVVCGTLVMGMPGETRHDVEKTIELIRDLESYKSLIVPLFFVPLGDLNDQSFFGPKSALPEHWILLAACIEHDFRWINTLMDELFSQNRMRGSKASMMKLSAWYMQRRLKPYLELMREGKCPLKDLHEEDREELERGFSREEIEA